MTKTNAAECAPFSSEESLRLADEADDARLLALAVARMEHADLSAAIPAEKLYSELGITKDELDAMDDVELE